MVISLRPTLTPLGLVLLATALSGMARGADAVRASWSPQEAATYLDGRAYWWLR